ncbi:hypothetical protein OG819_22310 [Streptomyces sp. NBC_01549]|uniref:hypothetical protein n=1 Tax=Streptomyces sp. NBC_01549 TaxID=2975874 RepID=UPI0022507ADB|nr:hypothetical protein [Streptomyces sp. NBC_01549]MCX4592365.1 hypothetical protein [Streptomyces sp. NBC_01549]
MEGWKFWWGIGAFFLGGLATQLNGWLTYRRQRADKLADERAAVVQRREEFELRHLVEVNQLLRDLMAGLLQLATAARLERYDAFPEEEIGERYATGQAAVTAAEEALVAQVGFILDDRLRALVEVAIDAVDEAVADVLSEEMAHGALRAAGQASRPAFAALSARVRELYAGRALP